MYFIYSFFIIIAALEFLSLFFHLLVIIFKYYIHIKKMKFWLISDSFVLQIVQKAMFKLNLCYYNSCTVLCFSIASAE